MRKLLCCVGLLAATANAEVVIDGVAAVVNDKVITYSDVQDWVRQVVNQLGPAYQGNDRIRRIEAARKDALDNLIERHLILQEFKDKGYSFPDTVVEEQLNEVIASEFGGDRAALIKTLQAEKVTLTKYREQIRDRTIVQSMRFRKTQSDVVVSPYKIQRYYQEHPDTFKEDEQIRLRMIVIKRQPVPAPVPAAETNDTPQAAVTTNAAAAPLVDARKQLATEILGKLDAGANFEQLARAHSEGKESQQGGQWGWVKRDELRKELSDAAFALKAGQHSRVIETEDNYYLLRVDEIKPARVRPLAEARDEIEKILLQEQRVKLQTEWVKRLRAKAYVRMF